MSSIGDLFFQLRGDGKMLELDAKKSGAKAGETAGKSFLGGLKSSNVGKGLAQGLGFGAALGGVSALTTATGALTDAVFSSIDAASAMSESVSKVGVVFGDSAGSVKEFGETAATSMGLSNQAALEATGTLGNLLLSMGKTQTEAADMSMTMVQLAADLASFNNVGIEEVLMAMRSGLTGEIAPLRRFGVNLTDVTLKQKAMSLGLYKGTGLLDTGAKSAAAYALILEQTTTAQGDFARTSDGLANTQRTLNAQMEDLSAEIGEKLLPVMLDLAQFVSDEVVPQLGKFTDALNATGDAAKDNSDPMVNLANILHDLFKDEEEPARTFLGSLFDGLNAVAEASQYLASNINDAWTFWDRYTDAAEDARLKNEQIDASTREAGRGLGIMDASGRHATAMVKGLGAAAKDMATDVVLSSKKARDASRTLRDAFVSDARAIIGDYYDPIIAKADLLATEREIADQRAIISSRDSTKEQIADARQRLTELAKTHTETLIELAATGDLTKKQLNTAITDYMNKWSTANAKTKAGLLEIVRVLMLVKLAAIQASGGLKLGGGIGTGVGGREHGGPVSARRPYIVGERRPELFVPDVSGHVYPSVQAGLAAVDGTTTNITNVKVEGLMRARDPFELDWQLRRLQDRRRLMFEPEVA